MALHWSITEVSDWKKKQEEDKGTLECIIWSTLSIGMNDLNEKTSKEFLYRLNRFSREVGELGLQDGKPVIWTMEMLQPWFGLSTNATQMSNVAFDRYLRKRTKR